MADNHKDLKSLKVKASSLQRIQKEYFGYKQEEQKQLERIEKLKIANADEADVNKQEEVLQETIQMYPNIIGRLQDAMNDLQTWMDDHVHDPLIQNSEEKVLAVQALGSANEFLQAHNPAQ